MKKGLGFWLWPSNIHIESGDLIALIGDDLLQKKIFCDWLSGFIHLPDMNVAFDSMQPSDLETVFIFGPQPSLYSNQTVQETIYYKTKDLKKEEVFFLIERLFSDSLKSKINPQNLFQKKTGEPLCLKDLSTKEYFEVMEINTILRKNPILILDWTNEFMQKAIAEGYSPSPLLFESGKTILVILPKKIAITHTAQEAEHYFYGRKFTGWLQF